MPKRSRPDSKPKTQAKLEEFLNTYDAIQLRGALASFEGSTGWELLKAYISTVQRRYEVDALDLMAKSDGIQAATYASGYAKALDELKNEFVEGLHQTILGKSQVVEVPRPEE